MRALLAQDGEQYQTGAYRRADGQSVTVVPQTPHGRVSFVGWAGTGRGPAFNRDGR